MRNKRTVSRKSGALFQSALRKLEASPGARYEEVLTAEEYNEAVQMMRAAVEYVLRYVEAQRHKGKRPIPPARFQWHGFWYPLQYSNMGRVFIATQNGARVLGSGYFAI